MSEHFELRKRDIAMLAVMIPIGLACNAVVVVGKAIAAPFKKVLAAKKKADAARIVAVVCMALLASSCATQVAPLGVPAYAQVSSNIWRGGQPTEAGWNWLASNGVKRVVKLNMIHNGVEDTEQFAVSNGLLVFRCPIPFMEQTIGRPDQIRLDAAVAAISQEGTFVHCTFGKDRTGLVIGMYRVRKEGWSKEAAYSEMIDKGFHPALLGLQEAWDEYAENVAETGTVATAAGKGVFSLLWDCVQSNEPAPAKAAQ